MNSGRFGANSGLADSSCDAPCRPGYYCPAGSTNETAKKCGGTGVFCPLGSPAPVPVSLGYYSTGGDSEDDLNTRHSQSICERGFYCQKSQYPQRDDPNSYRSGVFSGTGGGLRFPCPSGSFGDKEGLVSLTAPRPGHVFDREDDSDFHCSGPPAKHSQCCYCQLSLCCCVTYAYIFFLFEPIYIYIYTYAQIYCSSLYLTVHLSALLCSQASAPPASTAL